MQQYIVEGVTVKALSWINVVLGVWMIVAGFALSAAVAPVMGERIVAGIVIVLLALGVIATRRPVFAWLIALAGLWTLIAPAVLNYAELGLLRTNDIVVGVLVLLLGFFSAISRPAAPVVKHA